MTTGRLIDYMGSMQVWAIKVDAVTNTQCSKNSVIVGCVTITTLLEGYTGRMSNHLMMLMCVA